MILMEKSETILYSHHKVIEGAGEPEDNTSRYEEYRNKWEELPVKKEVSDFPLHLDIELTNSCNLKCPMCYRRSMRDKEGLMDFALFKKVVDEGQRYGLPSINLSWRGEPLLHPDFFTLVKYAKRRDIIDIRINTNGTLLDDNGLDRLIESRIDRVIFSIDGATKDTYEKVRAGADFSLVTANIRNLIQKRNSVKKENPSVELQIIDMRQTRNEIGDFIRAWKDIVNRIIIVVYRNPFGKKKDKFRVEGPYTKIFPCPQLWQRLVIGWDGKVYKCCGDTAGLVVLGDAKQESLYGLWHSERLNKIRKLHENYEFSKIASCKICEFNKCAKE